MFDPLISVLAPHLCSGCGNEGALLCQSCKNDIISEPFSNCVACGQKPPLATGICPDCDASYIRAWCASERRDQLRRLIGDFKFANARSAYRPLAALLHERLPELPDDVVVVPVPTVSSHVRQRGYDHMLLVARAFASERGLRLETHLQRAASSQQKHAGRQQRIAQAKSAFVCDKELDPAKVYLLLDDVVTTGATLEYATRTLMDSGARMVWTATISRQPVD